MYSRINHKNEYKDKVKRSSMKNVLNIYIQDLISRIYVFWQRCPQTFDTHVFSGSSKTSEKNPGLQGKFWTFQTYLEQGKLNSEEKFQSTVVHFPFPPDSTPLAFDFESPCPALPALPAAVSLKCFNLGQLRQQSHCTIMASDTC